MTYSMAYGYRWFMNVYDILLPPTYHWEIFRIQQMEVLVTYHISAIFCGDIPGNIGLKQRPEKNGIGTSNQSVPEMASDQVHFNPYILIAGG